MPSSQLAQPSPKRKRDLPLQTPLLNTTLRPVATTPPPAEPPQISSPSRSSGADSPRNAVADQLRDLSIVQPLILTALSPLSPTEGIIHKKPRLAETSTATSNPKTLNAASTMNVAGSSQSEPQKSHTDPDHPPSPQPFALTWQDSEITGHLADPSTDPDDDGTGLNGIGFKPTPAIAYARSQKRKQQLFEWKARENREARAKRSERRRRGVDAPVSRETLVEPVVMAAATSPIRRTVKFAM